MQKFIVTILFLILMPFYSWAISLEEIQSNPERYVKMDEDYQLASTFYMDVNSIQSLCYEPPYYTLQGDVYGVSWGENFIGKMTGIFYYDYRRSGEELAKSIRGRYRNITNNQLNQAIYQELKRDSGVEVSLISGSGYDKAGKFLHDVPMSAFEFKNDKIDIMTLSSRIANYVFYRYYNINFWGGIK